MFKLHIPEGGCYQETRFSHHESVASVRLGSPTAMEIIGEGEILATGDFRIFTGGHPGELSTSGFSFSSNIQYERDSSKIIHDPIEKAATAPQGIQDLFHFVNMKSSQEVPHRMGRYIHSSIL